MLNLWVIFSGVAFFGSFFFTLIFFVENFLKGKKDDKPNDVSTNWLIVFFSIGVLLKLTFIFIVFLLNLVELINQNTN
jgi:hypothetical protein